MVEGVVSYKDKDWLYNEYVVNNKNLISISEACGVSKSNVWYYIEKFNIKKLKLNRYTKDGKKTCDYCKLNFDPSNFHKKSDNSDGLCLLCKSCFQAKYKVQRKTYRDTNKIILNKRSLEWVRNNKEKQRKNRKKYWQHIKDKVDIRLKNTVCAQLCSSLKNNKSGRHWETLVGYTVNDLRVHLEKQFEPWMTWENYGKASLTDKTWQIDHIKPISLFVITSAECEDFKKCWELNNLRPIDAFENILKGNKIL